MSAKRKAKGDCKRVNRVVEGYIREAKKREHNVFRMVCECGARSGWDDPIAKFMEAHSTHHIKICRGDGTQEVVPNFAAAYAP